MSKPGICPFCEAENVVLTIEHVFPESWYPDSFTQSQMLKVPACSPCNQAHDRFEKKLFLPLLLSLDTDPRTQSILARAMRSEDADAGKTARDREHRQKKAAAFVRRSKVVAPEVSVEAPWTPMGRPIASYVDEVGRVVEGTPTFDYGWENLEAIAIKLLRGVYFDRAKRPLGSKWPVWATAMVEDPTDIVAQWKRVPGCETGGGFPFEYSIAVDPNSLRAGSFLVLWDSVVLFASNLPRQAT